MSHEVDDNRWLTLDKSKPGDIEYDELHTNGTNDFDAWKLTHRVGKHPGAMIDATNAGHNTIVVATKNVAAIYRLAASENDRREQAGDDHRRRHDSLPRHRKAVARNRVGIVPATIRLGVGLSDQDFAGCRMNQFRAAECSELIATS